MSEQTSQEPTMEEILASIRRIISEDDTPAEEAAAEAAPAEVEPEPAAPEPEPVAAAAPAPEPEPEPVAAAPQPEPEPEAAEEEELELTDKVETHGDLDIYSAPAEAPEPVAAAAPPPAVGLVSDRAASAAASSFGALSAAVLMPRATAPWKTWSA